MTQPYQPLSDILADALDQAQHGKGKDRHARDDTPFDRQPICEIARMVGIGFPLGQASKKGQEAMRLPTDRAETELLGAINYLAAAVIVLRESRKDALREMGEIGEEINPAYVKPRSVSGISDSMDEQDRQRSQSGSWGKCTTPRNYARGTAGIGRPYQQGEGKE